MCGVSARTRRSSSIAGSAGSSRRSAEAIFSAYVAAASSCAVYSSAPCSRRSSASPSRRPESCSSRGASVPKSSVADRDRLLQGDRAGIEALGDAHDRDPRPLVAGQDRALDRRRAAPSRQQRRVHVEEFELGEKRLAQQLTEGADDADLGFGRPDSLERLRRLRGLGPQDVDPQLLRRGGGRGRGEPATATLAAVRWRDDERRPPPGVAGELPQDPRREVRGAEVDEPHPSAVSGSGSAPGYSWCPRAEPASRPCAARAPCGRGSGRRRGGRSRVGARAPPGPRPRAGGARPRRRGR